MSIAPVDVAATALELTGLTLLAREVWLAQRVEAIDPEMQLLSQLQLLFVRHDYRGFWVARQLDQGRSPEKAQAWLSRLSDADLETAVKDEWAAIAPDVARGLERWEKRTTKAVMRRRGRALILGSVLIGGATLVHLFA